MEKQTKQTANQTFNQAFAMLQANLPVIPKSRAGYNYKYAPYEKIAEMVYPVLHKFGFFVTHKAEPKEICGNVYWCVTSKLVLSSSGEELVSSVPFDFTKGDQERGKSYTYGKRYNLVLLLGLSIDGEPDADDDQGEKPKAKPSKTDDEF